jgi:hypothetical protein
MNPPRMRKIANWIILEICGYNLIRLRKFLQNGEEFLYLDGDFLKTEQERNKFFAIPYGRIKDRKFLLEHMIIKTE